MNELNLKLMSYSEILKWYIPTTDNEKLLLKIMNANYEPNENKVKDLAEELVDTKDERDNFERKLEDLQDEYDCMQNENSNLEKIRENLEDKLSDYEIKFEELTKEING